MKRRKLVAWDSSALLWNSLKMGKDAENGREVQFNGKPVYVNSHHHGYDNAVQRVIESLHESKCTPKDLIMVFEGKNSKSKRVLIDSNYKQGRDHAPEAYEQFEICRNRVAKLFRELGALGLQQDYAEGDDTLAWLAAHTEDDLDIYTFDNDIAVLNGVNQFGATVRVWINKEVGHNKYGLFPTHLITTYKALVGDASDKIKGCEGFGPAKFEKFVQEYGMDGLQELQDMLAKGSINDISEMAYSGQHPLIKMIYDQRDQVIRCFDLARLYPNWVNTLQHPLQWTPGMVRQLADTDYDPRLRDWYGQAKLVTGDVFEQAKRWIMPRLLAGDEVALDIETSGCDEGDEWLERQRSKGKDAGVDVWGAKLAGLGLTFGKNHQYTVYFAIDHTECVNCTSEQVRQLIAEIPQSMEIVIHNLGFELPVLYREWGAKQKDNGWEGFLPNCRDTALESSYVDENRERGLKARSWRFLEYKQQTYDETTILTGKPGTLFPGGKRVGETYALEWVKTGRLEEDGTPELKERWLMEPTGEVDEDGQPVLRHVIDTETRQYRMNELPASHVFGYGADDPICTIALHNFYRTHMKLEHHYHVYEMVELDAAYQHALNFAQGVPISLETLRKLARHDKEVGEKAWVTLRTYLMKKGWEGTVPPTYGVDITPAQVKEAFQIVTGKEMQTQMRTISKLAKFAELEMDEPLFAQMLLELDAAKGDALNAKGEKAAETFNNWVRSFFKGEPQFNDGSPQQMCHLLYEVMKFPIKVRNKPTALMRAQGIKVGNPQANALALLYAIDECEAALKEQFEPRVKAEWQEKLDVLHALQLMSMVGTRDSLYYSKYPHFPHWQDGMVRSQHNQAAANTRRATEGKPNKTQLPKHVKVEGQASEFRSVIVPHRHDAVIVSMDFDQQELANMAKQSQDPAMLECVAGANPKKMHGLTAIGIAKKLKPEIDWDYDLVMQTKDDKEHPLHRTGKVAYDLGKKLNFTAEYGAMALKVSLTLRISEDEAQDFLDSREERFARGSEWKKEVVEDMKLKGFVRTMLGAVRHLQEVLRSDDAWTRSKADRQAVNFKIQSSCAEQTKLAEGAMWKKRLFTRFDAVCYGPIHDEVVASVRICDLVEFLPLMHACMVQDYAGMMTEKGGVPVPIKSSISFGPDFFHQTEIGMVATPEAIEKGLKEMYEGVEKRKLKEAA